MAGEVVVDALPYIDQGYDDPGVREAALAMVDEECRRYRPTKNYLEHLPPSTVAVSATTFETPMLRRELERLNARLPPEPLSMKRYELPPPGPGRLSDPTAWIEAVDNSHAQLEHQATRVMNLELQLDYACETWRAYLEVVSKMVAGAQTRLAALRKETAAVNWERKSVQTAIGSKLRGLEQAWVQLVSHNYSLERAIAELEADLQEAQNKSKEDAKRDGEAVLPTAHKNNTEKMAEKTREIDNNSENEDIKEYASKKVRRSEDDIEDENDDEDRPSSKKKTKPIPSEDMFAE